MGSPLLREEIDVRVAGTHRLRQLHRAGDLAEEERLRLRRVDLAFERLAKVLCERRALRIAGRDPDTAHLRPVEAAERYWQ
jgi:hypothetical protein